MKGSVKLPVFIDDARKLVNTTQLRAKYLGASYESEYCQWQTLHGLGSLMETASLIITPNAYLEGKLIASYPPDPIGDFDVTRATTATRVNSAGLVELVPYNLLQYSEDYSNAAWISGEVSLASGQSSPLGTNTAFKITGTSATNAFLLQVGIPVTSGNTYTASVYLKGTTSGAVSLRVDSGSAAPNNPVSYTTEWQRFTYTFTAGSTTATAILGGYNTWTGSEEIFVYGFQLVEGSTAKDYQKTETRLNIPRLDYSNGTCPSLLVEPQRTNLAMWSEDFTNAVWQSNGSFITSNTQTAPSGELTADTFSTSQSNLIWQTIAASTNTTYTLSLYVKLGTATNVCLVANNTAAWNTIGGQSFDSADGLNTSTWTRIEFTFNTPSSLPAGAINIHIGGNAETGLTQTTGTVFIWGAQLE